MLLTAGTAPAARAESPPPKNVAPATSPAAATSSAPSGPRFDPVAATEAYVARLTPEQIAKSNSYFEGGYWLQLWSFLVSSAISLILLTTGLAAGMRNLAERVISFRFAQGPLRTLLFGLQYFLFTAILSFPLSVYTGYFREHQYDLSNQTFAPGSRTR